MANTCADIDFDMSCDGSGNYQDSGDYLDSVGLPFCCGDVSQQGMSASNCIGLASDLYQQNACGSMGGQTQLSALSSQMVQKRRIPPLGPKATMRRATGDKKASGVPANLLIPIAFAGVGALVSKNKVKGAVLGLVIPFVIIEGMELLRG